MTSQVHFVCFGCVKPLRATGGRHPAAGNRVDVLKLLESRVQVHVDGMFVF